jgi:DNA-directed RNA polymerase sigma subunit (sigma70/sigma32)
MASTQTRRPGALKDYLNVVAQLPRWEQAEREALAQRFGAGEATAGVALLESFLPLVVAEAALHRGLSLRFEALIAAGNRGLAGCLRACAGTAPSESAVRLAVREELRRALAHAAVRRAD